MIIKDAVTGKIKKVDVDDMAEVTPTYGTIEWANRELEAGDKHYLAVARWIWEESQQWGLSLSATIKQLVEQGLKINYKTAHRWINEIPEYKQLQQEKKANPSPDALRMRKNYQPKNSQTEKPSTIIPESHPEITPPEWDEDKRKRFEKFEQWEKELEEQKKLLDNEEERRKRREKLEQDYQEAIASKELNAHNSYSLNLFSPEDEIGVFDTVDAIYVSPELVECFKKLSVKYNDDRDGLLCSILEFAQAFEETNQELQELKTRSNAERFYQERILPQFSVNINFLDSMLLIDDNSLKEMLGEGIDYKTWGDKFIQLGNKIKKLRVK